jgi:hypothetical protein
MGESDVVPISQAQYQQAVTVLAGMIADHWRRHDDHHLRAAPTDHHTTANSLSWPDSPGVNLPDGDPPPAEA